MEGKEFEEAKTLMFEAAKTDLEYIANSFAKDPKNHLEI